jgi:ribosome recycling factor
MNQYIENQKQDFDNAISFFKKEISNLRTGRANASILDAVQVEAYGSKTPVNGLASITVPEANSILITPWDKHIIKELEKAIVEADLGLSVVNEGDKIRLKVPLLTEENRKELVKKLNEKMESARIALRQIREEIKNKIEQAFKDKEIGEDEKFKLVKDLDEEIGKRNDEIKEIHDKKEKEIMTI